MKQLRVVAALIVRGTQVLVQQRPPGKKLALLWEFPGGKVEAGESEAQALARECMEELGVEALVREKVWETAHRYEHGEVALSLFRAEIAPEAVPEAREAHRLEWVERARLVELPFCEADREVLPRIAAGEI